MVDFLLFESTPNPEQLISNQIVYEYLPSSAFCSCFHNRVTILSSSSFSTTPLKVTRFIANNFFNCIALNSLSSSILSISDKYTKSCFANLLGLGDSLDDEIGLGALTPRPPTAPSSLS